MNAMGKSRKQDSPYMIFTNLDGWEWRVLKSWHTDIHKANARAFCAVSSPFTFGGYDMGDVYWSEILDHATLSYIDPQLALTMSAK